MNVNDITSVGCLDNHDGSIALAICLSGQIQPVFVTISKEELERSGGINGLNERKQDAVDFFSKYGEGRPVPPQIVRGNPVSDYELTKAVEALTRPGQGLAPNHSWHRSGDLLLDMHTQMLHRLSWDRATSEGIISPGDSRKWPDMAGVQYDDPTCLVEPAIKVERLAS